MGFDLKCLINLCSKGLSAAGAGNVRGIDASGNVDWLQLGMALVKVAGPYVVQYIGEMKPPAPVDVNQAFQDAEGLAGTKPYESPSYGKGRVRALLIGINYYGTKAQLSGCVNDVKQEMATFQKTKMPVEEMVILVDESDFPGVTGLPTRDNIVKYMAWLVKGAKDGDVLFMHYSGHGSQAKSRDQYEQYDQVICPVDYERAGCIIDDDMFAILAANLAPGVRLTILFDCCHSGSMLDLPFTFVCGSDVSSGSAKTSDGLYHMKKIRDNNFSRGDVLMISGCQDSQTSADVSNTAALGNGTSGSGGAATQCLTYTMLNTKNLSYLDAVLKTREMLKQKRFEQVPQLSASKPINLQQKFSLMEKFNMDETMRRSIPAGF